MEQAAGLWVVKGQPGKLGLSQSSGSQRGFFLWEKCSDGGTRTPRPGCRREISASSLGAQHIAWATLGTQ